jgi:hypothetical protein
MGSFFLVPKRDIQYHAVLVNQRILNEGKNVLSAMRTGYVMKITDNDNTAPNCH